MVAGESVTPRTLKTYFYATAVAFVAGFIWFFCMLHGGGFPGGDGGGRPVLQWFWSHWTSHYAPERWVGKETMLPLFIVLSVFYLVLANFSGRLAETGTFRLRALFYLVIVISIPLLFAPSLFSSDVVDYICHGRIMVHYHASPYQTVIGEIPEDLFTRYTPWKETPAVYGPIWLFVAAALTFFLKTLHGGFFAHIFVFKLFETFFHLVNGWLVWEILHEAAPRERATAAALALLNPLALIEFAGNGHNDAFLIFILLLGFYWHQRKPWPFAFTAFVLATLVKLYALPCAGFYAAMVWRGAKDRKTKISRIGVMFGIVLAIVLIAYLPFWNGFSTISSFFSSPGMQMITKSPADYLYYRILLPVKWPDGVMAIVSNNGVFIMQKACWFILMIVCAFLALRSLNGPTFITACSWFMFFWCYVGATWFMPWYATVFTGVAVCSTSREVRLTAVSLSLSVLLFYVRDSGAWPEAGTWMQVVGYQTQLFVFIPPIILLTCVKLMKTPTKDGVNQF